MGATFVVSNNYSNVAKYHSLAPATKNYSTSSAQPVTPPNLSIFDTGCTNTLLRRSSLPSTTAQHVLPSNLSLKTAKPNVRIQAQGQIPISIAGFQMPAHLFKDQDLAANLLSPSDLTNEPHNAECRFHKHGMGVYDKPCDCGTLLAFYPKSPTARIWSISDNPSSPQSNFAIKSQTAYDFVQYYHAIFGSPPASTFYRAVRHKWITIKDLSPARIFRNWPNSLATAQGHMQQMRQGVRSTGAIFRAKRLLIEKKPNTSPDFLDTSENTTNELHVRTFNRRQAIHVDATGRYPEPSIDGFEYLLIFVYKNYIHVELLRDRSAKSYILA